MRGATAHPEIGNDRPMCFEWENFKFSHSFKNTGKNTVVTLWFCNILKNNLLASL
jgi:hypothetical protein